jgi:hypothetical protein
MLPLDLSALFFPIHAKRRVGQGIIKSVVLIPVIYQRVAKANGAVFIPFHQQVRSGNSVGTGVEILPKDPQIRVCIHPAQVILRLGQHPARATSRLQQFEDPAWRGQDVIIRGK